MPGAQTAVLYRRSNGQPLSILDDNLIGSGGEGSIYTLDELPDLVAKVYHSPSGTIGAKLALMVDNPPNMPALGGHVSIAWPLDTLHSALPVSAGNTVGFLMHKISSMQPVTSAYNPAARKRNFPHYTYKHLCAVAINIAIVVDAIHDRNYVIGDINESNIMVSADGLVTLIDTDSFQVFDQSDGTIYRSPVGKPEYTSPDLQGHRFDQVDRDVYHDRFGLGVIIYQLLLEGIHPYQGRWTGSGEPPAIEGNIASGYFLYSQNKSVPLVEGPGFMPRHALDASIGNLFGLCFETGHDRRTIRPAPDMWEQTITQAVGSLAACPKNSQHLFFRHSPACPWCERRTMRRGRDPFPDYSGSVLEPLIMRSAVDHSANASATQHQPAPWQPQTPPRTQHQPAPPQPQPTPPQPTPPQPTPSQPQPAPLQPQPAPLQHQPAPWQPQTQGRRIFAGVSLPSSSWGVWGVLLAIVGGISFVIWGVASLVNFLEFDPFGTDGPVSAPVPVPTAGGSAPGSPQSSSQPPTSLPVPAPAVAALPPGETPTPTPTVEPSPTFTPSPPSPTPIPIVAAPPPPTETPTPEPTPTREPIPVKPDLALDAGTFVWHPENPSLGDTVTFSITVKNEGGDAVPSRLVFRIYSVTNHVEPVLEGGADVPAIPAGNQIDVSFDWIAQAGPHSLEIEVDVTNQMDESAEGNNTETQLIYNGTAFADLVIQSIGWSPDAPVIGDTVTIPVTVANNGDGRAAASAVQLYVDDDLLGEAELSEMLPGESETANFNWVAEVGPRILRALADSGHAVKESDEDNNDLASAYEATIFADLIVESIAWEPQNPSVGDEVTFTVTVMNQGTSDAGESTVELSLIPQDGSESSSEVQLADIPAGGSATAAFQWQAEPGEITLTARADVHETIMESDEDNNDADEPYDATQLADLVVVGIGLEPDRPAFGEDVTVTVTLENRGDGDSLPTGVRLLVDDVEHGDGEGASLSGLPAGGSDTVSFTWIAEMGAHTFSADVDYSERVVESDDTNNRSEMFEYDGARVPDLVVSASDWRPESPSVGDTVTFSVVVENRGDAGAGEFYVSFRDESSIWQPMEKMVSGDLAAGRTTTVSFEWPAEADPHQFVVVADSRKEVTESDEDNNELTVNYDATVAADLAVSSITSSPRKPSIDEDTTIRVTIRNDGQGRAGSSILTLTIAGPDGEVDQSNRRVEEIAAGASSILEFQWEAKAGSHTFTAAVDSRGVVAETDESNNVLTEEIVTALADLNVSEVQASKENPSAGDRIEIRVRVKNVGRGDSGRFTVSLYVDGADQPHGSERIGSLDRDASVDVDWDFRWQAVEGCHRFIVVVDGAEEVPEEDEGNNRSRELEICVQ